MEGGGEREERGKGYKAERDREKKEERGKVEGKGKRYDVY